VKALGKLGDSRVHFADFVLKINKRMKVQRRIVLLTERHLLNLDDAIAKGKVNRAVPYAKLESIGISSLPDNYVIVRVTGEHDYVLIIERKVEFLDALRAQYFAATGSSLTITTAAADSGYSGPPGSRSNRALYMTKGDKVGNESWVQWVPASKADVDARQGDLEPFRKLPGGIGGGDEAPTPSAFHDVTPPKGLMVHVYVEPKRGIRDLLTPAEKLALEGKGLLSTSGGSGGGGGGGSGGVK
jgi:hypothetical protein